MTFQIPFGDGYLPLSLPEGEVRGVLTPAGHSGGDPDETAILDLALGNPIASPTLAEIAKGKRRVVLITSDHTRPVPSAKTLPPMLGEIRRGEPQADITILVATGMHRAPTDEEMRAKFGDRLVDTERFVIHNSFDDGMMVHKGTLPSGCEFWYNRLCDEADLLISDGFIEPHFFAGFSGGRKSVLPGVAATRSVKSNHSARLVGDPGSRTGNLADNPIHRDMVAAARMAKLSFILNVTLDDHQRILAAFAGDPFLAHEAGCEYLTGHAVADAVPADIVVTSNGGYPLDQNIYQSVKSMTAAEACVNPGGVIICVSECRDGHGGEQFRRDMTGVESHEALLRRFMTVPDEETPPDQWQSQILARILTTATVILVAGDSVREDAEAMGLRWTKTLEDAMAMAKEIVPAYDGVTIIPNGISVIIR